MSPPGSTKASGCLDLRVPHIAAAESPADHRQRGSGGRTGDIVTKRTEFRTSSALVAVTYDDDTAVLEVEFRQGETYRYFMVPRSIVTELLSAPSVGHYFSEHVRGRYKEQRID